MVDIRSANTRPDNIGGGVIYEFWLKSPEEKTELPGPGEVGCKHISCMGEIYGRDRNP